MGIIKDNSFKEVWKKTTDILASQLSPIAYSTFIECITPVKFFNGKAFFVVPANYQLEVIESKYYTLIGSALAEVLGFDAILEFSTGEVEEETETKTSIPEIAPTVFSEYTFDSYVVGSSNRFAYAACQSVANTPAESYNPLFIWGGSGLGKTHLLWAIRHQLAETHPEFNIVYAKGDEIINDLVTAIGENSRRALREKYRNADVLLMDDIQFISGTVSTQEEVFHIFNTLYESKKQIILTADRPPNELHSVDDRLRSRFLWGLVADIQAPDIETRMAIVRRKSQNLDIALSDEIIELIATKLKSNIRQLEGAVKKIKAMQVLTGERPTMVIAQTAIRDAINEDIPEPISPEMVIQEVAKFFNLTASDLTGKRKTSEISQARHTAMYVLRETTQLSYPDIGNAFGGKDHTSVLYATRQVEQHMQRDQHYKNIVNDLIKNIKER